MKAEVSQDAHRSQRATPGVAEHEELLIAEVFELVDSCDEFVDGDADRSGDVDDLEFFGQSAINQLAARGVGCCGVAR